MNNESNKPTPQRIIPLDEIVVSLEEAKQLNNSVPSAIAWVFNKHAVVPEFVLKPVEKMTDTGKMLFQVDTKTGNWETWNTDVFQGIDFINAMINAGDFYYAPLKKSKRQSLEEQFKDAFRIEDNFRL